MEYNSTKLHDVHLSDEVLTDIDLFSIINTKLLNILENAGINTVDDDASTLNLVNAYNKLLKLFKNSAHVIALFLCTVFMCISPSQKIYGDTIDGITAAPTGTLHKFITGNTPVYTKEQFDNIISEFPDNMIVKRYAMFVIPLNECKLESTLQAKNVFTSFELQASTNNFTAVELLDNIVYWSMSAFADVPTYVIDHKVQALKNESIVLDAMRMYIENSAIFVSSDLPYVSLLTSIQADAMRYLRISNSNVISWPYYVSSYIVIVDVNMCYTHDAPKKWLYDTNDELSWTYIRVDASGNKELDNDFRPLWKPIAPIKWFSILPNWANQDIVDNR